MNTNKILSLWNYRSFIIGSVTREFKSQYTNSLFGITWSIVNPLSMIAIYTIIFSRIMQTKIPGIDNSFGYSIYLCSGIITWGLFLEIVNRGQNTFIENANYIKKMIFPIESIPVIITLNAIINFSIIFIIFSIFLYFSGNFPGIIYLYTFLVIIIQIIFSISLGIIAGILNVFFNDVKHFMSILLQFWFWLTPIVYPSSILPKNFETFLLINPMYLFIESYHMIFVNNTLPRKSIITLQIVFTTLTTLLSIHLLKTKGPEMIDEL